MSTHARPLADQLAAASDAELTALFQRRGVRADAGWEDFFDAAESLLETGSIQRVLATLTAHEAAALGAVAAGADAGPERAALTALGLLQSDGSMYPPVAAAVHDRPVVAVPPPFADPAPSSPDAAAHAAERAFTTVAAVADLLLFTRAAPLALLAAGTVSAGERKLLAEHGVPGDIEVLVDLARDARLVAADGRALHATTLAEQWLHSPAIERWEVLARGSADALPRGIRSGTGWVPPSAWDAAQPWDAHWPARSAALRARAVLLALLADDGTEPEWARPLRTGGRPDTGALAALLPAEVDRIFLQNDLTAISPGPLAPALDVRLRTMAARESAAQASSYRFTEESVSRALVLGETAASITEFLGGLSLTGIPQPLAYLVDRAAHRHGLVRVSTDKETGRTRIESTDPTLLEAIGVDQTLRPLGLTVHASSITTRVSCESVYWALVDARYPATLVDEHGEVVSGARHPFALPGDAQPTDYANLIAALRAHQGPDADAAWLDRELEAAVRAKAVVRVVVGMPDGSSRELVMEATGIGGGRLRGRDRAADIERTLPISSIRSAAVIEP
ncbi:helicase-associated domain-containing protein [Microbacterium sp.]|uniref:helicase-associated domain-containing protein n=1 Tax=Microbacterium sp. TaxID=51671 RepID=UPI0039E3090F